MTIVAVEWDQTADVTQWIKMFTNKYLIQDGMDLKVTTDGNTLTTVGTAPATEEIFKNNGMDNLTKINNTIISLISSSTPQILVWTDEQNPLAKSLNVTGLPYPKYRYKVEVVEPYTLLKNWSAYTDQNVIDYAIVPSEIITTINPYTIKVTVEQLIDGKIIEAIGTVSLYDTEPTVMPPVVNGLNVRIEIGDNENDRIQYLLKLNGKQIYPESGFTDLFPSPYVTTYTLNQEDILIGQINTIEIVARDEFGKESNASFNFIGDYAGIMFMDELGKYFSNHIGEVLQYLDFGQIIAGRITQPKKVRVVNKNGFPIANLTLTVNNIVVTSKPDDNVNSRIEVSKTQDPFLPEPVISHDGILEHNSEIPIYVRIVTDKDNDPHSVMFDIIAEADPV